MRCLITGSGGFVGEATRNEAPKNALIYQYDLMGGEDIRDYEQLRRKVSVISQGGNNRFDAILHLAAIARFSEADANPIRAFETNALGTMNVVRVCEEMKIPLVYASTGSVYMPISKEPPITEDFPITGNSVYGCTKALGEEYVKRMRTPWIILRYAHIYDSIESNKKRGHGLVGGFIERIQRGLEPTLYGGKQSNDFTYITDVARSNWHALKAPWDAWNNAYNIGTGQELTAEEAGKIVCETMDYDGKIDVKEGRTVDPQRFVYDVSKAKKMLNWEPQYTFDQGIKEMFKQSTKEIFE